MPVKRGSPTVPMPGYVLETLDEGGQVLPPNTMGTLAIKLPLPPACLPTLYNDDGRFRQTYLTTFPGYYTTSDAGYLDEDGYVYVMGRTDDVINVAGHRLTTGSMEAVVATHPAVAECAVIGVPDALKGERPATYVVLKSGATVDAPTLRADVVALVRDQIGPVAALKDVFAVPALPKTRSGKIMRRLLRDVAEGRTLGDVTTLTDAGVMGLIQTGLAGKAGGSED